MALSTYLWHFARGFSLILFFFTCSRPLPLLSFRLLHLSLLDGVSVSSWLSKENPSGPGRRHAALGEILRLQRETPPSFCPRSGKAAHVSAHASRASPGEETYNVPGGLVGPSVQPPLGEHEHVTGS